MRLLDDGEIQLAKAEAVRLSWTHKAHPPYEKEKHLLKAQQELTNKEWVEWIEENMWKQGSIGKWKARLKEIGNVRPYPRS